MYRDIISNELFTILLMVGIAIVTIAKLVAPQRFSDFIYIFGNSNYLKIYAKDQKILDKFDSILFSNLIISLSIFCYLIYQYTTKIKTVSNNILFELIFGITAFFITKALIERLIASLFKINKLIAFYLFQKISFRNYLGILLLPINALLIFTITPSLQIYYIITGLLLFINFFGIISSLKTHLNIIKDHLFYFILYLCALEIAPYLILCKVFIL